MIYDLWIPGNPIPKARTTQASKWSKRSKRTLDWQNIIAHEWMRQASTSLTGKVYAKIVFFRKDRRHVDIDNLCKSVFDGIGYARGWQESDKQVYALMAMKFVDPKEPGVRMIVQDEK